MGLWVSTICFHKGACYVSTFANNTDKTYIYTTKDIEKGPWKAISAKPGKVALQDKNVAQGGFISNPEGEC